MLLLGLIPQIPHISEYIDSGLPYLSVLLVYGPLGT
jgi:hypothetical protein